MSIDRKSGKTLWKTVLNEELPHSKTHNLGSWASNSPVTDGKHIYAYFGSHGLYCVDMTGKLIWKRDLGKMQKSMSFGEGSSPVLYKDPSHRNRLIVKLREDGFYVNEEVTFVKKNQQEFLLKMVVYFGYFGNVLV